MTFWVPSASWWRRLEEKTWKGVVKTSSEKTSICMYLWLEMHNPSCGECKLPFVRGNALRVFLRKQSSDCSPFNFVGIANCSAVLSVHYRSVWHFLRWVLLFPKFTHQRIGPEAFPWVYSVFKYVYIDRYVISESWKVCYVVIALTGGWQCYVRLHPVVKYYHLTFGLVWRL